MIASVASSLFAYSDEVADGLSGRGGCLGQDTIDQALSVGLRVVPHLFGHLGGVSGRCRLDWSCSNLGCYGRRRSQSRGCRWRRGCRETSRGACRQGRAWQESRLWDNRGLASSADTWPARVGVHNNGRQGGRQAASLLLLLFLFDSLLSLVLRLNGLILNFFLLGFLFFFSLSLLDFLLLLAFFHLCVHVFLDRCNFLVDFSINDRLDLLWVHLGHLRRWLTPPVFAAIPITTARLGR